MNCSRARHLLYPHPQQCEVTIEHAGAIEHAHGCADCAAYFQQNEEWAALLRDKAAGEAAPERLRAAILQAAEPPARPLSRSRGSLSRRMAVAVLAAVLPLLLWLFYPSSSQSFFEDVCEDHVRYLRAQAEISSPEAGEIENWFRDQANLAVQVPVFDDTTLLGGRLCFLWEKKAALVFYHKRNRPLSLFQFSKPGVSLRSLDRAVIDGVPIWRGSFRGFNVAAFEQRGMLYVLVSDLRESELLRLASSAYVQSRGY